MTHFLLFTPGPWSYRGSLGPASNPNLRGPHVVENATGIQIAIMNGWRSDVSEANARLIAAAPELYEALEAAAAYVELFTGNGVRKQPPARYIKANGDFDAEAIARDARAALAKVSA